MGNAFWRWRRRRFHYAAWPAAYDTHCRALTVRAFGRALTVMVYGLWQARLIVARDNHG